MLEQWLQGGATAQAQVPDVMLPGAGLALVSAVCGVIWFAQFVHYPLYASIDAAHFPEYHRRHLRRARTLLAPLLLADGVVAVLLLRGGTALAWISIAALVAGLLLTATAIESCYRTLGRGFQPDALRRLLGWNLARGLCWTLRVALGVGMLMAR